jgi:hypothetical protein
MIAGIVERGRRKGEVRSAVDARAVASIFIACIEGGVMLTQLYGDATRLSIALGHLRDYVERELRPAPTRIAKEAS